MRCKLVKCVLLTLLAAALLGCGAEKKAAAPQAEVPKAEAAAAAAAIVKVPAYELEYANIVDGVYDFLANGNAERLPQQGTMGIYELRDHFNADEAVKHLGYTLLDINNDKVPELIFAFNNNEKRGKGYYGKELYAVYTFVDGQVKFVDEGWARSSLELQPDGTLLTRGNISNAEYLLAVHDLLKDGSTRCLRLYFTKAQEGAGRLDVYRSSDGRAFTDGSERMQMTADEFFEMGSELSSYSTEVELLPLHEYKQRGSKFKGLAMPICISWACMSCRIPRLIFPATSRFRCLIPLRERMFCSAPMLSCRTSNCLTCRELRIKTLAVFSTARRGCRPALSCTCI